MALTKKFAPLEPAKHDVKHFDCGKDALNTFLGRFAAKHARLGISSTWALTEAGGTGKATIAAFFTLAAHTVTRGDLPAQQRSLPRFQLPVVLIAQLAVVRTAAGKGLGEKTLITALRKAVELTDAGLPAVGIVLDSLDKDALGFYQHFGTFDAFTENPMRLFMPMAVARQL
ncbi:MAG: GNAT family N-acetyltransferase [Gammaproteobacteria bacterium]|nr:GNAT family N-acetyltransferase [Gammaproteobacteria bacterium]